MTLVEARAILNNWPDRKEGEHSIVLQADALLKAAWDRRQVKLKKPLFG
jgi:hypothetical protein